MTFQNKLNSAQEMNYLDVKELKDLLLKWQTAASNKNHEKRTILKISNTTAKFQLVVVLFFMDVPLSLILATLRQTNALTGI